MLSAPPFPSVAPAAAAVPEMAQPLLVRSARDGDGGDGAANESTTSVDSSPTQRHGSGHSGRERSGEHDRARRSSPPVVEIANASGDSREAASLANESRQGARERHQTAGSTSSSTWGSDATGVGGESSLADIHHDLELILEFQRRRLHEAKRVRSSAAASPEAGREGDAAAGSVHAWEMENDVEQEVPLAPKISTAEPHAGSREPAAIPRDARHLQPHERAVVPLLEAEWYKHSRAFSPIFPASQTGGASVPPAQESGPWQPPRPASAAAVFAPGSNGATPSLTGAFEGTPMYEQFLAQLLHQQRQHHEVLKQRTRETRVRARRQQQQQQQQRHGGQREQTTTSPPPIKHQQVKRVHGGSGGGSGGDSNGKAYTTTTSSEEDVEDEEDDVRTEDFYYDRFYRSSGHTPQRRGGPRDTKRTVDSGVYNDRSSRPRVRDEGLSPSHPPPPPPPAMPVPRTQRREADAWARHDQRSENDTPQSSDAPHDPRRSSTRTPERQRRHGRDVGPNGSEPHHRSPPARRRHHAPVDEQQRMLRHRSPPLAMMPGHQRQDEGYTLTTTAFADSQQRHGRSHHDAAAAATAAGAHDKWDEVGNAFDVYLAGSSPPHWQRQQQENVVGSHVYDESNDSAADRALGVMMNSPSTIREEDGEGLVDLSLQQQQPIRRMVYAQPPPVQTTTDSGAHKAARQLCTSAHAESPSPVEPFADILNEEAKRNSLNSTAGWHLQPPPHHQQEQQGQLPWMWSAAPIYATGTQAMRINGPAKNNASNRGAAARPSPRRAPLDIVSTRPTPQGRDHAHFHEGPPHHESSPQAAAPYSLHLPSATSRNNGPPLSAGAAVIVVGEGDAPTHAAQRSRQRRPLRSAMVRTKRTGSSLIPERGTITPHSGRAGRRGSGSARDASRAHATAQSRHRRTLSQQRGRSDLRHTQQHEAPAAPRTRAAVGAPISYGEADPIHSLVHRRGRCSGSAEALPEPVGTQDTSRNADRRREGGVGRGYRDSHAQRPARATRDVYHEQEAIMAARCAMAAGVPVEEDDDGRQERPAALLRAQPRERNRFERMSTSALLRDVKRLWAAPQPQGRQRPHHRASHADRPQAAAAAVHASQRPAAEDGAAARGGAADASVVYSMQAESNAFNGSPRHDAVNTPLRAQRQPPVSITAEVPIPSRYVTNGLVGAVLLDAFASAKRRLHAKERASLAHSQPPPPPPLQHQPHGVAKGR